MAGAALFRTRRAHKPPYGVQIDWSHYTSRGLVAAWHLLDNKSVLINLANRVYDAALTGAPTRAGCGADGPGVTFNNDDSQHYIVNNDAVASTPLDLGATGSILYTCFETDQTNTSQPFSRINTGGGGKGYNLQHGTSNSGGLYSVLFEYYRTGDQAFQTPSVFCRIVGELNHICVTFDAGGANNNSVQFYANGQAYGDGGSAGTFNGINSGVSSASAYIGGYNFGPASRGFSEPLSRVCVWNRALSAQEAQLLTARNAAAYAYMMPETLYLPTPSVSAAQLIGVFDQQTSGQMVGVKWQ